MNSMKLDMRKIKNTPYKVVFSDHRLIGMFNGEKFHATPSLTSEMQRAADIFHAATLPERLKEVRV
jgi:hypothetical protein